MKHAYNNIHFRYGHLLDCSNQSVRIVNVLFIPFHRCRLNEEDNLRLTEWAWKEHRAWSDGMRDMERSAARSGRLPLQRRSHSNRKSKRTPLAFCASAFALLTSCQDSWNSHYGSAYENLDNQTKKWKVARYNRGSFSLFPHFFVVFFSMKSAKN